MVSIMKYTIQANCTNDYSFQCQNIPRRLPLLSSQSFSRTSCIVQATLAVQTFWSLSHIYHGIHYLFMYSDLSYIFGQRNAITNCTVWTGRLSRIILLCLPLWVGEAVNLLYRSITPRRHLRVELLRRMSRHVARAGGGSLRPSACDAQNLGEQQNKSDTHARPYEVAKRLINNTG